MKKLYKRYDIEDPIYRAGLSVFTGNMEAIKEHLLKCGFPDYGEVYDGKFIEHNGMRAIILNKKDISTISHEIIHYVFSVFDCRGIPIEIDNDEVFAYYFEMTLKNVLSSLKMVK